VLTSQNFSIKVLGLEASNGFMKGGGGEGEEKMKRCGANYIL